MEKDFDELSNVDEACEAARHYLSKVGIKTVKVPKFLLAAIKKFNGSINITKANAVTLRTALKNNTAVLESGVLENQTRENKLLLLEFATSDENFEQMNGIKLIPLADGTFAKFDAKSIHPIFVDSVEHPRTLLPLLRSRFLDEAIPQKIWSGLSKAAKKNCKHFNYKLLLLHGITWFCTTED
jgi:sacsin